MPTLPLYTPNAVADASHRVIAPGGYEWWHFDARSADGSLRLAATLGAGFGHDLDYLARYAKYRRRPTRHPPPAPAQFPLVRCAVLEGTRLLAWVETRPPPHQYEASARRPEVRVGQSEFVCEDDGSLRLCVSGGAALSAELTFRPLLRDPPREVSLHEGAPDHAWIVAQPTCEASGTVQVAGEVESRVLKFRGRGYHDHAFGIEPPGLRVRRSIRGSVLFEERSLSFLIDDPIDPVRPPEARLVEADAAGLRERHVAQIYLATAGLSANGIGAPRDIRLALEGGQELRLDNPMEVRTGRFARHLLYSASYGAGRCSCMCRVESPPRVRY